MNHSLIRFNLIYVIFSLLQFLRFVCPEQFGLSLSFLLKCALSFLQTLPYFHPLLKTALKAAKNTVNNIIFLMWLVLTAGFGLCGCAL